MHRSHSCDRYRRRNVWYLDWFLYTSDSSSLDSFLIPVNCKHFEVTLSCERSSSEDLFHIFEIVYVSKFIGEMCAEYFIILVLYRRHYIYD